MSDKFKNKYRIPSTRLQNWDYGLHAAYFVTICTQRRECYFGEVVNGKMNLSGIGIIADILWHEIKKHAPNIELGEFVVMPNHVHGILILNGNDDDNGNDGNNDNNDNVETRHALSLQSTHALSLQMQQLEQLPPNPNNKPSVKNDFKTKAKTHCRPLSVPINRRCQNTHIGWVSVLPGNRVFTTILSAMNNRIKPYRNTSSTIH